MDRNAIEAAARAAMAGRRTHVDRPPGYILAHGQRVARIALNLAADLSWAGGAIPNVAPGDESNYAGTLGPPRL